MAATVNGQNQNPAEIDDWDDVPEGGRVRAASDEEITAQDVAKAALKTAASISITASTRASAEASKFVVGASSPEAAVIVNPAIDSAKTVAAGQSQRVAFGIIDRIFSSNNDVPSDAPNDASNNNN
ncbi:MAG: hypothetical protein COT84_06985 [Chlamydiae bacterium CG10_big_fil_rev_8_21_14_0_10_35_9]|nr:MAG: hypothetical protein COT84_06985 [Chlamydiae bacterium CG10_big_fil_rev_8_21_14_0_10_35_9]